MNLEEFRQKYPELKKDVNALSEPERAELFEDWGGVCACGGNGHWCCWDLVED